MCFCKKKNLLFSSQILSNRRKRIHLSFIFRKFIVKIGVVWTQALTFTLINQTFCLVFHFSLLSFSFIYSMCEFLNFLSLARIWWFAIWFIVVTTEYCWQRCSRRQRWRFIRTKPNSSWCSSQHFSIKYETKPSRIKRSWNITWVSIFPYLLVFCFLNFLYSLDIVI